MPHIRQLPKFSSSKVHYRDTYNFFYEHHSEINNSYVYNRLVPDDWLTTSNCFKIMEVMSMKGMKFKML